MSQRDVVVTGMGAVTPLGIGVAALWDGVRAGCSAVDWLSFADELDADLFPVRFGAEVREFDVRQHLGKHCEVRSEKTIHMGLVAAQEALRQARLIDGQDELRDPASVISTIVGSGHGTPEATVRSCTAYNDRGIKGLRPSSVSKCMFNAVSCNISIYFGLRGANYTIASACASGNTAIGAAYRDIKHGYADIVLCGGTDTPFIRQYFGGWASLRVLAKSEDPTLACKPFDQNRSGMAIGEGAGMLVLESRQSAQRRDVPMLAQLVGYGTSSDAHHVTAPQQSGQVAAIRACLDDSGVTPDEVDYINMHGTGTQANDETEAQAVHEVFGSRGATLPASSIKPIVGHSLGAIGGIEAIASISAVMHAFAPPTINCQHPDPDIGLDYVPQEGRHHKIKLAMSNSFAFGGDNACILVKHSQPPA